MGKGFAYFLLTCALVLVLGHSILPHNHMEGEYAECEIRATKDLSIADILKLALAHNLGANHLEEFKNCKKLEFTKTQDFMQFTFTHECIDPEEVNVLKNEKGENNALPVIPIEVIICDNPLRAPPCLI
ncbi:MAG: hypothetical protein MI975_15410 [Cytophagales bacterium]|nr:hypothetical protein [Cytophagales bacterium]